MRGKTSLFTGLVLLAGCFHLPQSAGTATRNVVDRVAMKDALGRNIPPGTPADAAERFMKGEGFECSFRQSGTFSEEGTVHEGMDYLYCDRTDHTGSFWVVRRWQVAVVIRQGAVADLCVSSGLTGP